MIIGILPRVLSLTESILTSCRSSILHEMLESLEQDGKYGPQDYSILEDIVAMPDANLATDALITFLPNSVKAVLDKWKSITVAHIPWVSAKSMHLACEILIFSIVLISYVHLSRYFSTLNPF